MPSPEAVFSMASTAVLPGWLLLVFAPRWRPTARLVCAVLIPGLLAVLYAALIAARWGGAEGGFSSLANVQKLFADPWLLLAGWVHYLVFDLFIGAWEVRDAGRLGIPHLLVVPCLVLTFLFGPVGLLLYGTVRAVRTRRVLVDEAAA
ncbi:MAG TPA: ABA4-like family protein [Vicinamibacteria bacterium]|nr:ABA4-like family protein [Vicinamibacteria bacterium]